MGKKQKLMKKKKRLMISKLRTKIVDLINKYSL